MISIRPSLQLLPLAAVLAAFSTSPAFAQAAAEIEFFETKVRPLLVEKCAACHGEKVRMADLKLTSAEGFAMGVGGMPIVEPGDPAATRLIRAVSYQEKVKMPPTGKLPQEEIAALRKWVEMGAPWPGLEKSGDAAAKSPVAEGPESGKKAGPGPAPDPTNDPTKTDHWAFQPIVDHAPPAVDNVAWAKTGIDQFILAQLEEKGLQPAPRAGKLTLLRRAKFDLHGLPPSLEEIEEFLADESPRAFANLIDRLLASPHYGERWGRHWLDVARYADSTGVDEDKPYVHAWRYRDYVVDAFNRDLPYDQFVREQIAGDLMPPPPGQDVNINGIVATGFLALGPKALAQQDKVQMVYDVVDEQIDTTAKAFLGLTIACARCHDHKFDPILTKDYYALASIFASTASYDNPERDGSGFVVTPLVRKDIGEGYFDQQKKIKGTQRVIGTLKSVGVTEYMLKNMVPRIAGYMIAARGVYQQRHTIEHAAKKHKLDPGRLEKWVAYLKPSSEPRAHLDQWHQATAAEVRGVAQRYQDLFGEVSRDRMQGTLAWLKTAEPDLIEGKRVSSKELTSLRRDPFHTEVGDGPLEIAKEEREKVVPEEWGPQEWAKRLAPLRARAADLEANAVAAPPMACSVAEGKIVQQAVFVRGRHDSPGDIVGKRFPIVLGGWDQQPVSQGSGRKELAEFLTREDNPLPPRVMANRIWTWHFGQGLVRTPNNFGIVGERPTHPELLDYLARRFIDSGWSVKTMHRMIMLSSTYQMSSRVSDATWKADSSNLSWARFERRRLTLEEIRDSFLALSGALDTTVGGNVEPRSAGYSEFERNNRRFDPDETTRRSVYLPLHRNKLPALLNLFDFGDATTSSGKRGQTNVAPQALFMMNSEFANKQAKGFAERLLAVNQSDATRIQTAHLMALARKPSPEEAALAESYLRDYAQRQTSSKEPHHAAWKSYCKMMLASNEFHYVD